MNLTETFSIKEIDKAYMAVFRDSTNEPGFYFWDLGNQIDSKIFRGQMVYIKDELSKKCKLTLDKHLNYQSVGRFNHQHSSKLHRDTANEHSFLMLGYEPTKIESKVYVADFTKCIEIKNITLEAFFNGDYDTNLIDDDGVLDPFTTELTPFEKENYRILLLNNSKSFKERSFGVFHSAKIPEMINKEYRVINYIMMHLCDKNVKEQYTSKHIMDFKNTEHINL